MALIWFACQWLVFKNNRLFTCVLLGDKGKKAHVWNNNFSTKALRC